MKLENSLESGIQMIMMASDVALSAVRTGRYDLAKVKLADVQFHSYALLNELDAKPKGRPIKYNSVPLLALRHPDGSMFVYTKDGMEITDMLLPSTLDRIEEIYIATYPH